MMYTGLILNYISGKRLCELSYLVFCVLNFSVINVWCKSNAFFITLENKLHFFPPSNWQHKKGEALLNTNVWIFFNVISLDLLWQILLGIIYDIMAYSIPQGINKEVNCSSEMYNFHPLPLSQQLAKAVTEKM